jgi:hypothetical protein
MMDAPPSLVSRNAPSAQFLDEDTRDGDAPTRLTQPATVETTGATAAVTKGPRAIQEKVGGRTNLKDRTSGEKDDTGKRQPMAGAAIPKPKATVAHRSTVGAEATIAPAGKRSETTLPPFGSTSPEPTQPEQQRSLSLLPGIILIGLAVVIVLLVMLLFRI